MLGVALRTLVRMPAFLFTGLLFLSLQGCSLLQPRAPSQAEPSADALQDDTARTGQRNAFSIEVQAPDRVRGYLLQHLDIQRYRHLDELGQSEVSRLMVAAEADARTLLGTLGYFTPTLTLSLHETPDSQQAARAITIAVESGPQTVVRSAQIDFSGSIASDPSAAAQRDAIRSGWSLKSGQPFTETGWDNAKTAALHELNARRFPTGRLRDSRADIDADQSQARLRADYDSGPAYRFGPLEVRGSERYDPDGARRIARLPYGTDYDQQKLLDAQQRLAASGYYDSVFLTLDPSGPNPLWAPVIAQVREAPLQKVVLGVGVTTDSGARLSLDYTHNQLPLLDWRAVTKISLDRNTKSLSSEWTAIPAENGWRSFASAGLQRETSGSFDLDGARLKVGKERTSDHIDRSYYLQYDRANYVSPSIATPSGSVATVFSMPPPPGAAVSVNWAWSGRYFDNASAPRRGQGLALELGAGYTLIGPRAPFLRADLRWLGVVPLGSAPDAEAAARQSRLALRTELGVVSAHQDAQIPATLMFLTGGDTTVRGYSYREIGTVRPDGTIVAGRYMAVASAEWQRPVLIGGKPSDWESVMFVDAGAVADQPDALHPKVGVGVGARWRSPVGPVQADLAYGVATHRFRLHLRVGFSF